MKHTALTSGLRTSVTGDFAFENDLITLANSGSFPVTLEAEPVGGQVTSYTVLMPGEARGFRFNAATRIYGTSIGGNGSIRVSQLNVPLRFLRSGFNPAKLIRFWRALSQSLNSGGVDIVVMGDSITRGLALSSPGTQSMTAQICRRLQSAWNPFGVTGGDGFIPAKWTWSNGSGGTTNPTHPATRTSTAYDDRIISGAGNYLYRLNTGSGGSVAFAGLTNVTDLEAVHQVNSGSGVTAGWAITGTGSSSGNINSQGTLAYGAHTLAGTGLSPSGTYTWTLSPPGSGDVRGSGLIRYNGDYGAGIRVHNLGCSGTLLYDPASTLGYFRADDLPGTGASTLAAIEANLDRFTDLAATDITSSGARRGGLVIIRLLTNDQSAYANSVGTVASGYDTMLNYLRILVARALARPSLPSVLISLPAAPGSSREELYRITAVEAARQVEQENEHVAICEEDTHLRRVLRAGLPSGFDSGDLLHWSLKGHMFSGDFNAQHLIDGRNWARDNGLDY
jgi:hypothetical protein